MVDCAKATAADHRGPALERAFGPAVRLLWEDVLAAVDAPNLDDSLWYFHAMDEYLAKRLAVHGLKRENFKDVAENAIDLVGEELGVE
jgi:hypothetical protein